MATVLDKTRSAGTTSTEPAKRPAAERTRLPRPKPVSVNGVVIPRGEIGRETQHHPAAKPIDAWMAAARALAVRELLLQEAQRLDIRPAPLSDGEGRRETDDEAKVRQLIEQEVRTPTADEETCRRVYEQRQASFRSSDLYAVRHILLAAPPTDDEQRSSAKRQAMAIIDALARDPGSFAQFAAEFSACTSKLQGGALGQISRGQTVEEFEAALADAPVGTVLANPVETRFGFHVVVVDQKIEGVTVPFELVREQIAEWLEERSRRAAIRQYISLLAGRATITGINLDASASSLVQ